MPSVTEVDIQQTKTTYSDLSQLYDVVVVVAAAADAAAADAAAANGDDDDYIKILNVNKMLFLRG